MSIDGFFSRRYHARDYNCAHFAAEVWQARTGADLRAALNGFLCRPDERRAILSDLRDVTFLPKPVSPCLVLAQAPSRDEAHVGVWLNGRVLHLTEGSVHYQPLEVFALGFQRVRFFLC